MHIGYLQHCKMDDFHEDSSEESNEESSPEYGTGSQTDEEILKQMGYTKFIQFIPLSIFVSILMVIGLIGNISVCIFYRYKVQRTPFTRLIVIIGVVDTIICFLIPRNIIDFWYMYRFENSPLCKIHRFINYSTAICSGLLILTIGSFRFRMVCQPLKKQFTLRHANIASFLAVFLAIILSLPMLVLLEPVRYDIVINDNNTVVGCDCGWTQKQSLQIYIFLTNLYMFLIFAVTLIVLGVIYGIMVYKIIKCRKIHLKLQGETAKLSFYDKTNTIRRSITGIRPKPDLQTLINNRKQYNKQKSYSEVFKSATSSSIGKNLVDRFMSEKTLPKSKSDGELEKFFKNVVNNFKPTGSFKHDTKKTSNMCGNEEILKHVMFNKMEIGEDKTVSHKAQINHQETMSESLDNSNTVSGKNNPDFETTQDPVTPKIEEPSSIVQINPSDSDLKTDSSNSKVEETEVKLSRMVLHLAMQKITFNDGYEVSPTQRERSASWSVIRKRFKRNSMLSPSAVNQKLTLMLLAITVVFILSFLPYFIEIFTRNPDGSRTEALAFWRQFLMRTYLLNSALNPFIYGTFNAKFKVFVKGKIFCCCSKLFGK